MSEPVKDLRRLIVQRLLVAPVAVFAKVASQGGLILLFSMVAAMVWRNSSAGDGYLALWATPVRVGAGGSTLEMSLLMWINDAAMAVFFLVVGAEIKNEVTVGALSGIRRAMVPALAAIGGMVVPAVIYVLIAPENKEGFGTPMATDIAFSLAAIRAVGGKVPDFVVKVLMGLAIIDDLGAILVIALFYGGDIHADALAMGGFLALILVSMNLAGVWRVTPYLIVGVPLWMCLHHGGIHPTIAGVVVGMCIPARGVVSVDDVVAEARALVGYASHEALQPGDGDAHAALSSLERRLEEHQPPLERLVRTLNPWISWVILPVFALANGGVLLEGMGLSTLVAPVSLGIIVGLFVGKQVGIFGTLWVCVRTGLLPLPMGVRMRHLWGMAALAGIGFTMSLFVAALAFEEGSALHNEAKAGILVGSIISAVAGMLILRLTPSAAPSTIFESRDDDDDEEEEEEEEEGNDAHTDDVVVAASADAAVDSDDAGAGDVDDQRGESAENAESGKNADDDKAPAPP
jgi:NhaA family Na+:H+ antiporter